MPVAAKGVIAAAQIDVLGASRVRLPRAGCSFPVSAGPVLFTADHGSPGVQA